MRGATRGRPAPGVLKSVKVEDSKYGEDEEAYEGDKSDEASARGRGSPARVVGRRHSIAGILVGVANGEKKSTTRRRFLSTTPSGNNVSFKQAFLCRSLPELLYFPAETGLGRGEGERSK